MDALIVIGVVALVVIVLTVVAVAQAIQWRGRHEDGFGAGGTNKVPLGTNGVAKTALAPSGIVHAAGEDWTARSGSGAAIASGEPVRVVGQDGLTLIVDAVASASPAGE